MQKELIQEFYLKVIEYEIWMKRMVRVGLVSSRRFSVFHRSESKKGKEGPSEGETQLTTGARFRAAKRRSGVRIPGVRLFPAKISDAIFSPNFHVIHVFRE